MKRSLFIMFIIVGSVFSVIYLNTYTNYNLEEITKLTEALISEKMGLDKKDSNISTSSDLSLVDSKEVNEDVVDSTNKENTFVDSGWHSGETITGFFDYYSTQCLWGTAEAFTEQYQDNMARVTPDHWLWTSGMIDGWYMYDGLNDDALRWSVTYEIEGRGANNTLHYDIIWGGRQDSDSGWSWNTDTGTVSNIGFKLYDKTTIRFSGYSDSGVDELSAQIYNQNTNAWIEFADWDKSANGGSMQIVFKIEDLRLDPLSETRSLKTEYQYSSSNQVVHKMEFQTDYWGQMFLYVPVYMNYSHSDPAQITPEYVDNSGYDSYYHFWLEGYNWVFYFESEAEYVSSGSDITARILEGDTAMEHTDIWDLYSSATISTNGTVSVVGANSISLDGGGAMEIRSSSGESFYSGDLIFTFYFYCEDITDYIEIWMSRINLKTIDVSSGYFINRWNRVTMNITFDGWDHPVWSDIGYWVFSIYQSSSDHVRYDGFQFIDVNVGTEISQNSDSSLSIKQPVRYIDGRMNNLAPYYEFNSSLEIRVNQTVLEYYSSRTDSLGFAHINYGSYNTYFELSHKLNILSGDVKDTGYHITLNNVNYVDIYEEYWSENPERYDWGRKFDFEYGYDGWYSGGANYGDNDCFSGIVNITEADVVVYDFGFIYIDLAPYNETGIFDTVNLSIVARADSSRTANISIGQSYWSYMTLLGQLSLTTEFLKYTISIDISSYRSLSYVYLLIGDENKFDYEGISYQFDSIEFLRPLDFSVNYFDNSFYASANQTVANFLINNDNHDVLIGQTDNLYPLDVSVGSHSLNLTVFSHNSGYLFGNTNIFTYSYVTTEEGIMKLTLYDQRGKSVNVNDLKIFVNDSRLYDQYYYCSDIYGSFNLTITDLFDVVLYQNISEAFEYFKDIEIDVISLKIANHQKNPVYISVVQGVNLSSWLFPYEIEEFRVYQGNYNITVKYCITQSNFSVGVNGTKVSYIYSVTTDTAILVSSVAIIDVYNNLVSLIGDVDNVLDNLTIQFQDQTYNLTVQFNSQTQQVNFVLDNCSFIIEELSSLDTNFFGNFTLIISQLNSNTTQILSQLGTVITNLQSNFTEVFTSLFSLTGNVSLTIDLLTTLDTNMLGNFTILINTLDSETTLILNSILSNTTLLVNQLNSNVTLLQDTIIVTNGTLFNQTVTILSEVAEVRGLYTIHLSIQNQNFLTLPFDLVKWYLNGTQIRSSSYFVKNNSNIIITVKDHFNELMHNQTYLINYNDYYISFNSTFYEIVFINIGDYPAYLYFDKNGVDGFNISIGVNSRKSELFIPGTYNYSVYYDPNYSVQTYRVSSYSFVRKFLYKDEFQASLSLPFYVNVITPEILSSSDTSEASGMSVSTYLNVQIIIILGGFLAVIALIFLLAKRLNILNSKIVPKVVKRIGKQ